METSPLYTLSFATFLTDLLTDYAALLRISQLHSVDL